MATACLVVAAGTGAAERLDETPDLAAIRAALRRGDTAATIRLYDAWRIRRGDYRPFAGDDARRAFLTTQAGYDITDLGSLLLEPRDETYLQRQLFLAAVARAAVGDASTNTARAERLFRFVTREMIPFAAPDREAFPDELLCRGYGSCDQMAWTLCALGAQVDLDGMLLFLRKPGATQSHHTVAALKVDGKWKLFDPFCGLAYTEGDMDLWTALQFPFQLKSARPKETEEPLFCAEHLPWAQFLVYHEARGDLPRWNEFSQVILEKEDRVRLFLDPLGQIATVRQEAAKALGITSEGLGKAIERISTAYVETSGGKPVETWGISPYGDPILLESHLSDPAWMQSHPRISKNLRAVREAYLSGKPQEALKLLNNDWTASSFVNTNADNERLRVRALVLEAIGKTEEALTAFSSLRNADVPWTDGSRWNQADCLQQLGRTAELATLLETIPPPRKTAAQRWKQTLPSTP